MTRRPSFGAFYLAYLAEHRHPANRALHLAAKLGIVAMLAAAWVWRAPLLLLAVPPVAVLPCWLGHWAFERNRPTAWTRPSASLLGTLAGWCRRAPGPRRSPEGWPIYSFLADLRMCLETVLGRVCRLRSE